MNRTTAQLCSIGMLFLFAGECLGQSKTVPYTEVLVTQFAQRSETTLHKTTSSEFIDATDVACTKQEPTTSAAPLVVALGGVIVDWLFSRSLNKLSKRLKKRIEEYSESYSNKPIFRDMFATGWNSGETCVVAQRIECTATAESVKAGSASCGQEGEVGYSVGIKLLDEGKFIRMLPYAMTLESLKPRHHGGDATIAATVRVEAPGANDGAGKMWKSDDVKIGEQVCDVPKDKKASEPCTQKFDLSPESWARSRIIPIPPKTVQAMIFTVGEVGEPPQGLKGFSEFLDASQGSLSDALSEAFKTKIKLKEE